MNKQLLCLAAMGLAAIGGLIAAADASSLTLVEDGRAIAVIVTGEDDGLSQALHITSAGVSRPRPARVVENAAAELSAHLIQMAEIWRPDYEPRVVRDVRQAPSGPRILLGTAAIEAHNLQEEAAALPYPGYIYRVVGDDLLIFGSSSKGTANGVYGFMQDELGIRWYGPQELFHVVPAQSTIAVGPLDRKVSPSFTGRFGMAMWVNHPSGYWAKRYMRMAEALDAAEPFMNASHNLHLIFPPDKYFEAHPEYYAMRQGERRADSSRRWSICFSNPEVVDVAAQAALRFFRESEHHHSFSMGINDTSAYCECDRCAELQPKRTLEGASAVRGQRVSSDMYYHFVNEVARRVGREFPDRYLGVIAYRDVTAPPLGAMEENVHVVLVNDVSEYFDESVRRQDEQLVQGWVEKDNSLGMYYYTGLAKLVPAYFPRLLAAELKDKHSRGFSGLYSEVYPGWPWRGPMAYLEAQLWWDVTLDVDKALEEYFRLLFGPAAGPMQEMYELFEQIHMRPRGGGFLYEHYKLLQFRPYTREDLEKISGLLAEAHAAIPVLSTGYSGTQGREGQRVAYVSSGLKVFMDMLEGYVLAQELEQAQGAGDTSAVLQSLEAIQRINAILDRHETLYRETIINDPAQSRRYTHDTCAQLRTEWRRYLSDVAGNALASISRQTANRKVDAFVQKRLEGMIDEHTGDEYARVRFLHRSGKVKAGPNLIKNPGFEVIVENQKAPVHDWQPTSARFWNTWRPNTSVGVFDISDSVRRSGRRAGRISGVGSGGFLTNVTEVTPGDWYSVEAYVRNTAHTAAELKPTVSLELRNRQPGRLERLPDNPRDESSELDEWVKLELVFQAPADFTEYIAVMIGTSHLDEGDVYVDDVSFRRLDFD